MLDDVLSIPDHLRDALWRVESARLEPADAAGLLVCGMGGSAIGGDLAAAALGDRLAKQLLTVRGYEPPSWVTPEWTVLCSSYSGNTEETLACFAAAEALGARRLVASTGGSLVDSAREAGVPVVGLPGILQPRAAVAYMFTIAAEVAALAGVAPRIHTEIDAAAAFLTEQASDLQSRAAEISARLLGGLSVIVGADLTAPVARRWKTQFNENSKLAAFFSELPEADHNELCGWDGGAFSAVMLEDADQHPRLRRRFELTAETIAASGAEVVRVQTQGETRVARLLWATMLGDLVSLALADALGVDPLPVEAIEGFKAALGGASMRAMVLAAGLGTRLRPITYAVPKPMVPVLNRPVMEHIVRLLARNGFSEAIANLHWFPETIEGHFGDGSALGIELSYSHEEQLLGTSGGVRNAAGFLGDSFLVISGDALTDIDLGAMREFHESHDEIATLATKRVRDTTQFGVAITGVDGRIQGFQEKPEPAEALSDLANCGIYMFRSEIFDFFPQPGTSKAAGPDDPDGFADWAMDVFPALLENDVPFYSHEIEAYWNDIGNLDELRQGNLDALRGAVQVDPGAPEVADGIRAASPLGDAEVDGPVLIGEGVELGAGIRIQGPAIVGDGCRIGEGAWVRDSILLAGAEVAPGAMLVGAIAGHVTKP